jgi:hypothetical protein
MDFESRECCRFASHVRIGSCVPYCMLNVVCDEMLLSTIYCVHNASAMHIQYGLGQITMCMAQWFGSRISLSNQKPKVIDQIHHCAKHSMVEK